MTDTAVLAVLVAAAAGALAGMASARARRKDRRGRGARASAHFTQGIYFLTAGQRELAISEMNKVEREQPGEIEVIQVLSHLLGEAGQVERAIQLHQGLLARDLNRGERAQVLAGLGTDFLRAGFLDRAARAYGEALEFDPNSLQALAGLQKLHEEQREWAEAYDILSRLQRLRKTDESLVLGHLQAEMGREAARAGRREAAETAFETALLLHRRVMPAHLGLAALHEEADPRRAAAILTGAIQTVPERSYLALAPLERACSAAGSPERFVEVCEGLIRDHPREWRARLSLARYLRARGAIDEALGLLLRALEANPQALLAHLEVWRTLKAQGALGEAEARYVALAEESVFYVDPHVCTACRYRAEDMLWRCPHCHEWNTLVEERVGPSAETG
jgi:lipopolysaccharide biosynthesis regulator YciM